MPLALRVLVDQARRDDPTGAPQVGLVDHPGDVQAPFHVMLAERFRVRVGSVGLLLRLGQRRQAEQRDKCQRDHSHEDVSLVERSA